MDTKGRWFLLVAAAVLAGLLPVAGLLGALLTGVFASQATARSAGSVATQLWTAGRTVVYNFVAGAVLLERVDPMVGLGVSKRQEREGPDISLHGGRVA